MADGFELVHSGLSFCTQLKSIQRLRNEVDNSFLAVDGGRVALVPAHFQHLVAPSTAGDRAQLRTRLDATIHHMVDQVLFIELGPVGGQTDDSIFSLGRPYLAPDRGAIVL